MTEKSTPCIRFDTDRPKRIGLPEAVFCEGKPRRALHSLLARFAADPASPILFTRLSSDVFHSFEEEITRIYDYDPLSRTAWNAKMPQRAEGRVAVVSAGTADGSVAREVSRTLTYLGWTCERFEDCGVAGSLSSMLSSCAPGVAVMNIDNGYGAACAAARILNAIYPNAQ